MRFAPSATLLCALLCATAIAAQTHTYRVDCSSTDAATLHSLEAVNALHLRPGDSLLFHRGDTCKGTLQPQGSGSAAQPIHIGAHGSGALPRILATSDDVAAMNLFNQEYIELDSLDISGSSTYGIHISGDNGALHNITLRNMNVHNIRGTMKKKESGLIVIAPAKPAASFSHIIIESVRAFDTTQWSGIFISGPSREHPADDIVIRNAVVHDVQGDGIVLFNAHNSGIYHSLAWHTGMQHQQSIGTPNAIWTWQCDHCTVDGNEAFLVDSPGVDGGAFDIDWGNTHNVVSNNFGHDTVGYCVAIFGANGPTRDSFVENNLCLHNGLSPRLAQRQGAILLMTWGTGSIENVRLLNNCVDWHAPGDTPLLQTGSKLTASNVVLTGNIFSTTGLQVVDDALIYSGHENSFTLEGAAEPEVSHIQHELSVRNSAVSVHAGEPPMLMHPKAFQPGLQWHLQATASSDAEDNAQLIVLLKSAAVQFTRTNLPITLKGDERMLQAARDASLEDDGVRVEAGSDSLAGNITFTTSGRAPLSFGATLPDLKDLGVMLRHVAGEPNYGRLPTLDVHATD